MKFGRIAVSAGEGIILAHAIRAPGINFKKGALLRPEQVAALEHAGIRSVIGARLEADDVRENEAAQALAQALAGPNLILEPPFTGRCNLLAGVAGLVTIDAGAVEAVNAVNEAITVATLPPYRSVQPGEMVATVKIIPFAVEQGWLNDGVAAARSAIAVAAYRPLDVAVVSTLLPALKPTTIGRTLSVLDGRLAMASASIVEERRVAHDALLLADTLRDLGACDLAIVFGASAITDRRDVIPVAIELAGGVVEHLGMPVDPGNLLLLGRLRREGRTFPIIGAPGCARSSKENGFDLVLRRILAALPVTGTDLRGMGVGGLLNEIATRPQSRMSGVD